MTPEEQSIYRARCIRHAYENRRRKLAAGLCGVCTRPRIHSTYYCPECTQRMRRRRRKNPRYVVEWVPSLQQYAVIHKRNDAGVQPDRIESVHDREQDADAAAIAYRREWEQSKAGQAWIKANSTKRELRSAHVE